MEPQNRPLHVLLVEDSESDALLIARFLRQGAFEPSCTRVETSIEMELALTDSCWDLIIADHQLPEFSGLAAFEVYNKHGLDVPFIIVSGSISEESAVMAMKAGIHDYVNKNNLARLAPAVARELRDAETRKERKNAERALRESEQRFRTLIEITPTLVFSMNAELQLTFANSRLLKYINEAAIQLTCESLLTYVHPNDHERLESKQRDVAREECSYPLELRLRRYDGVYRWHLLRLSPRRDGGTRVNSWVGFCTDIEEYKRAENNMTELQSALEVQIEERTKQIEQMDERYRILVESIKDYAILMLDPQGIVVSWTPAAERIKGYRLDEIVGKSFECFYTEADIEMGDPEHVLRAARMSGTYEEDGWRRRKDGSLFWANVVITAIHDESGKITGFSKMTRDITLRKRMEQDLRHSEEQFRILLECAPDAIVIADETGNLVLINAQAEKLFGYSREELIGHPVEILIPSAARERHTQYRSDYSRRPRVRQMGGGQELMAVRKNGSQFPVEISLSPIQTSRSSWVAAGIRDITDRKEAESRLVAERRRAEEANRAKSDFLATMSHEIRTPMNSILGLADLLWDTELNELQRDYVGRFRRAGFNLLTLINDILDLSKIESGRFELEAVSFNLIDLLNRTFELMVPKARAKNINLSSEVGSGIPAMVIGDPVRLQQVINNLVGNAIKFTEKGRVTLTINPHPDHQPGHLCFEVRDTGIGISSDKVSAVFEDFTQAESSTTRRFGGTGLGLGICRRLVQRMGGTVKVDSVLGQGSTFAFDVFLSPVREVGQLESSTVTELAGHRVLIVDDDATNRFILAEMCASWRMIPVEAASCDAACELVRNHAQLLNPFSLVLWDDAVPGTNSLEAVERLLRIDPGVSVILMSSDQRPGDVTKANRLGIGYAAKPVSKSQLFLLLSSAIKRYVETCPSGTSRRRLNTNALVDKRLTVLIAEDSEDNRFLFDAYLNGGPYEVTFVENGRDAVETFSHHRFDIVLMDIQMPVMDGLTAAAEIRSLEHGRSAAPVPIVALTADARPEDAERSRVVGCTAHLTKPISRERLVGAIEGLRCQVPNQGLRSKACMNTTQRKILIPNGLEQLSRNYIAGRRREIVRMLEFSPGEGLEDLRVFGHNMKGSGTAFGFPELTSLGAAIEAAAKSSDMGALANSLTRVKEYVDHASVELV